MYLHMRTSIDAAGRLVIPKALRDALALGPETPLEIIERDGSLIIEPAPLEMHLEDHGHGPFAVPDRPLPALTADQVRDALEAVRR